MAYSNSIYEVTYSASTLNLTPVEYRLPRMNSWLNSLISAPMQWLNNAFFQNYDESGSYQYISTGVTAVTAGNIVKFIDNSLWQAQSNVNPQVYNPTIGQISGNTSQLLWLKIQDDFVGVEERLMYSNQIIMFNYLLNNYFNHISSANKIYIQTENPNFNTYWIAEDDASSLAEVGQTDNDTGAWISEDDTTDELYNFTVFVPTAIAADLGINYQQMISNIANKYNFYSLTYNIVTY